MDAYKQLFNNKEINMILNSINEIHCNAAFTFPACHGRYHALFVVDAVEHVLTLLSYDLRTIELGKIAALLHDIGNIAGRWNHAQKSAALAQVFLGGTDYLLPEEKCTIIQAIEDHSNGTVINSAVGAALLIADKADHSKKRILPSGAIDDWHKNLLGIENVDISISDNAITFDYITTDAFSKDAYFSDYRSHGVLTRAAAYFNRIFQMQFNESE